ncbi:MAG: bifunctional phosphopantothenoylcysteine decarboxylase/phosphopantothenate--cysteine ligase CoaBC [Liquorilactobacillus nagelii]|uniref:Coenzyme A biosynthesis bifunctional protein CoaBC n=1 Tax=Liquorilactobacillus nagelii TaxID=82688 RepID=A0A3Q8D0N0_9LACO|nr:bifunctional phosphopantothenoylcysteine decarboxylase/phosphopantothenate--cysteine ligase CoaBC [Liquorilactobacillus nagelii]AUJ32380.1 phosphopantothenoylcysteine decarboxylase [Liquorilactobacillus nagelii]MCC7615564.1 bifunctional phosphopantothenoylcysteine decarboxylase/phosphopantothenate--cysteine ligase CoaBC [Liquorilactobacillus nagelii]MCI1699329.1 bifunctional phosphopantothenoylcysteine decarboxylase/phosphopantothenate--cysteine ligase CoaBC [Liquorilactobacillus nagelii]MCP
MGKKKILVCLTGGIALYKAALVVRGLLKAGFELEIAMTKDAQKFVTPLTFSSLIKKKVHTDEEWFKSDEVLHIKLADWSDAIIVIPATANILTKMAVGLTDNLVSASILASQATKYVIPAMNQKMLTAPATQRNFQRLKADGVQFLSPVKGLLAEGYSGDGRLPEPPEIISWLIDRLETENKKDLVGKKVLVSAGSTVEPLDPVRYLSNNSTGKMGFAIAKIAQQRGAEVTLVAGPNQLALPNRVNYQPIKTARQMEQKMLEFYQQADFVIMAAAVADFRPAKTAEQKIKKQELDQLTLRLVRNPDILAELGRKKQKQLLVGFAAETQELLHNATQKMQQKKVDLLVANDVSRHDIGFGTSQNEVVFLQPDVAPELLSKRSKEKIADKIFDLLMDLNRQRRK